ncbi:class D beta-lactamase [Martelella lutilitoris]|uniref:Class D beta-lactamase n=1 Tax=Martelella lutilitoris TaxID=2583532 RepID=A0A5C4JXW8_9HYPH|nr:class D beta-lactamase [Martelella lutilitoris]TNB49459.1 class D beta-lactamase [Martelella lutilitoris]
MRWFAAILVSFAITIPARAALAETLCTLVADAATGAVLLEEGDCQVRVTPASTFKVPLAVMGYDAGFLKDAAHPVLAYQEGDPDWGGANWRRDTNPADWLRYSVVWYSQRITHALGAEALTAFAQAFGYGNADFSGDAGFDNGLDRAWIASSLQVSPAEQVRFLRALLLGALPVREDAMARTRAIVETRQAGDWLVHGKTGAAYPRRADRSFDYAHGWGWYIGWAEETDQTLIFVRLTQTRERMKGSAGLHARDAFLSEWPALAAQFQ